MPVTRRGMDMPLIHGSVLQIGSAVLQLQLFAALSHTNRTFIPPQPAVGSFSDPMPQPVPVPLQYPPEAANGQPGFCPSPYQEPVPLQMPVEQAFPVQPLPQQPVPVQPVQEVPPQAPAAPRRRRSETWKEDWSE